MEEKAKDATTLGSGENWTHRALVDNGELVIYSEEYGEECKIVLSKEETGNLLDLLYNNRDEILKH